MQMSRIITLNIEISHGANIETIYPVVLCDQNNRVLIDCGYTGSLPKIEKALQENGLEPKSITHIILTHQDHDHIGAAAAFKKKYPHVIIMASAIEVPFISGKMKLLRLEQAEQLQKLLPPEQEAFGEAFCSLLRNVEAVEIDQPLYNRDLLPFCGGCEVLSTPGHTPGHISLYLRELNTIISGDAIVLEHGKPAIANPQFTLDIEKASTSMQMLLSLNVQTIICYHGGMYDAKLNT